MKKHSLLFSIAGIFLILFLLSCKKDKDESSQNDTLNKGFVEGTVYAKNGTTAISNAKVFIDVEGEIYLTTTNKAGYFKLLSPAGPQILYIESGRGSIFRTVIPVDIITNKIIQIPEGHTILTQNADLAYIKGAYDEIESIIIDSLGYSATEITVADLANSSTLDNYAGLFFNCGKADMLDSAKYENLRQYVINGGSIYASDWGVEYLTGDGAYRLWNKPKSKPVCKHDYAMYNSPKTCIGDIGGFIADSTLCTEKVGPCMVVSSAAIIASDLQAYLGVGALDVDYDLGGWEVIQQVSAPWEILIQDNVTYGPLAIRMYADGNNLKHMYSTSKDGKSWVTICHIPPGNPANMHTITINSAALPAHLAHGDNIGPCVGTGGSIYYTTFHNHPQGAISNNVQKILEYFVLNL
jgi:hypothetical protein